MALRAALVGLAAVLLAASQDSVPLAALEADSECPAGGAPCALNALQRRAQGSGSKADGEAKDEAAVAPQEDEEDVLADPNEADEEEEEEQAEAQISAIEEGSEDEEDFFGRRRRTTTTTTRRPAAGGTAKCCLCRDGVISWSKRGVCSHCSRAGIQKTATPNRKCQSSSNSKFPGAKTCASRCLTYFPRGGHSPSPTPGACRTTTDGTCRLFGCAKTRGGSQAVQCVKGKCQCKPGHCSNGHKCVAR